MNNDGCHYHSNVRKLKYLLSYNMQPGPADGAEEEEEDLSALPEPTREMYGRVAEINKRLKDLKVTCCSLLVVSILPLLLLLLLGTDLLSISRRIKRLVS